MTPGEAAGEQEGGVLEPRYASVPRTDSLGQCPKDRLTGSGARWEFRGLMMLQVTHLPPVGFQEGFSKPGHTLGRT